MVSDSFIFDTKSRSFIIDPYPVYKKLRNESPVYYSEKYDAWFISRYNDIKKIISNDITFGFPTKFKGAHALQPTWIETAENVNGFHDYLLLKSKVIESQNLWIVNRDKDDHGRIKKEFATPFKTNHLRLSEPDLRNTVINLLNSHSDKIEIDIIQDLSVPLTTRVFLNLLGLSHDHSEWIQKQSVNLSKLFFLDISNREKEQGISALINFMEFFRKEIKENTGGDTNKLIALLLQGKCLGRISMDEVLANLSFFILAGVQSTINFIGNLFYCLQQNPEQLAQLKKDHTLIEKACEETLRFETANSFSVRYALEDTELGGKMIASGQKLILIIGSANRDEQIFQNAETFNILREPIQHLAFGFGNRYCMGSYLSRLEAKLVLEVMLKKFPGFSIDLNQDLDWYPNFRNRGLNNLKVKLY